MKQQLDSNSTLKLVKILESNGDFIGLAHNSKDELDEDAIIYHSDDNSIETMHVMTALITYPEVLGKNANNPKNLLEDLV